MALKVINTNHYIKMDLRGNFIIYKSIRERNAEKKATKFEEICAKYSEIISEMWRDQERRYYDPVFIDLIKAWEKEAYLYYERSCGNSFPLMKQYIQDIEKSLPNILSRGHVWVKGETLEEVYEFVKKVGYFGETSDC